MKLRLGRIVFSCPLFLLICYLLFMILLLNLGFWQLNRAEEKKVLLLQQQQQAKTVLNFSANTEDNPQWLKYKTVHVAGKYDTEHQFLLDNQIFQGKAGYFVLTPFILEGSQKAVLVNRGWLPANPDRKILPDVQMKTLQTSITGRMNTFPSIGIKLAGAEIPTDHWPALVQVVNSEILAKKLGYALFSFQVELDANQPEGYTRQWLTTTLMPPEQHFGYALQWFGLAATLTILFFWYSSKKTHHDRTRTKKS